MSRIFREIFCGHFPWKLKDENLRKISPKFRRIFRRSLRKISQELRSGGLRAQQKNPLVSANFFVRNSGAGIGCANFKGAWRKCVLSAGKPTSIKFLLLRGGGGGLGVWGGGGSADFIFVGEDFSEIFPRISWTNQSVFHRISSLVRFSQFQSVLVKLGQV